MEKIRILLVEPNFSLGEMIVNSLQRALDAEIIFYQFAEEGILSIKQKEIFSLIIVRNQSDETIDRPPEFIAALFLNLIYDMGLTIPLIVLGEFEHSFKKYALVSEKFRIEEIIRLVFKALALKKEDFEYLKLPDYVPFPVKHFYLMDSCPCNVYIKLVKKTGDEYIKRLNAGENFNKQDLIKYEELGLLDFYIFKDGYLDLMNEIFVQTLKNMKKPRAPLEAVEMVGDSFVLGTDLMRSLGITPSCMTVVDQTLLMIKNQIQKSEKLGPLIKKLLDEKMSYSYRRSYLISALSYSLLPKMEWASGEHQHSLHEKICLVSYFHDLLLEDEKLLKISTFDELRMAKLTPKEMELVNNHAHRAALLVQGYSRFPSGVELIIKQHHGVFNGIGLPKVFNSTISPMAIFFIVVEEFASKVLEIPNQAENLSSSFKETIIPLKEKFLLPSYKKIVVEIENLIIPKK